ncbi:MAG: class I SAM-dependent methyltransferase [Beijerinckiaceae bacterium]|nr:MAG: class I SAM-dependent methyltransferase [Beijerinckiaceae bacterium]
MHILHKQRCRVCGCPDLTPVIDLGDQFLQGSFVKPPMQMPPIRRVPTRLVRCDVSKQEDACGLLQLAHSIPPEILYANYWYKSGTNETMRRHLAGIVKSAMGILSSGAKRALDIGCNDGTLLSYIPDSFERWGIDPSDIAASIAPPVQVINTVFPSDKAAHRLRDLRFDLVTSVAMFYDLEDPVGFARNIEGLLEDDGIWILEMSYMPLMLEMNSFDTVCHEHLEYYSLSVLNTIMARAGLRIFKVSLNWINGGSIRCYVCKKDCFSHDTAGDNALIRRLQVHEFQMQLDTNVPYLAFQLRIDELRTKMTELLARIHAEGRSVHVYGASTKGNVLLQWYGIDSYKVPYAADRNPDKVGALTLGTGIRIISEEESRQMKPDYYLVLPWHFKQEFLARERETILAGTKMIFPLPEIMVVSAENLDAELAKSDITGEMLEHVLGI